MNSVDGAYCCGTKIDGTNYDEKIMQILMVDILNSAQHQDSKHRIKDKKGGHMYDSSEKEHPLSEFSAENVLQKLMMGHGNKRNVFNE